MDQRVKSFTEHLLLLLRRSSGKRLGRESRLSRGSSLLTSKLRSDWHLATSGEVGGESLWGGVGGRSTVGSLLLRTTVGGRGRGSSSRSGVVGWHLTVRTGRWGHTIWHGHTTGHTGLTAGSVSRSVLHHLGSTRVAAHHGSTSHWHHTGLTVGGHGRVTVHGLTHEWSTHSTTTLVVHSLVGSLSHLGLESLSSDVLSLSEGDVEGLGTNDLAVHLRDSLGGLIGSGETNETKVLGGSLVVLHDLARGDGTERVEFGSESLVIPLVVEVLDVEVDTGRLGLLLEPSLLVSLFQLVVSLGSLLGSTSV